MAIVQFQFNNCGSTETIESDRWEDVMIKQFSGKSSVHSRFFFLLPISGWQIAMLWLAFTCWCWTLLFCRLCDSHAKNGEVKVAKKLQSLVINILNCWAAAAAGEHMWHKFWDFFSLSISALRLITKAITSAAQREELNNQRTFFCSFVEKQTFQLLRRSIELRWLSHAVRIGRVEKWDVSCGAVAQLIFFRRVEASRWSLYFSILIFNQVWSSRENYAFCVVYFRSWTCSLARRTSIHVEIDRASGGCFAADAAVESEMEWEKFNQWSDELWKSCLICSMKVNFPACARGKGQRWDWERVCN